MFTAEAKRFKITILKRDGYRCRACGRNNPLIMHHIKSVRNHPQLRLDPANVVILCKDCHYQTDNYGIRAWQQPD